MRCYILHRNRPSGQTMYSTTSIRPIKVHCGKKCESVQHLVRGYKKLSQKEHKRQDYNAAKKVHWDLCKKNGLKDTEKMVRARRRRSSRK